jgi:hypothetical protein
MFIGFVVATLAPIQVGARPLPGSARPKRSGNLGGEDWNRLEGPQTWLSISRRAHGKAQAIGWFQRHGHSADRPDAGVSTTTKMRSSRRVFFLQRYADVTARRKKKKILTLRRGGSEKKENEDRVAAIRLFLSLLTASLPFCDLTLRTAIFAV